MKGGERGKIRLCDAISVAASACTAAVAVTDIVRYAVMWNVTAFLTFLAINLSFIVVVFAAWAGRCHFLYAFVAAAAGVLAFFTDSEFSSHFNATLYIHVVVCGVAAVAGTAMCIKDKLPPAKLAAFIVLPVALFFAVFGGVWAGCVRSAAVRGEVRREIWTVPDKFDDVPCPQEGRLERLDYVTRAYATDRREVAKAAWVYLPYGYDEAQSYDILYLMHGTGDDEQYWLKEYSYNKLMLDNLIYYGEIKPLIVVTPTFYVEDDCAEELDKLTFTFMHELRDDLMPAVEGRYSTYAEECTEAGFAASRDHRAFAGLSRGAVTAMHSAFVGSLDYFSWFGTFSGSRTDADYFVQGVQSEKFANLPINYWYVSSGAFDFALSNQLRDYRSILSAEPRLQAGVNTSVDVFPMRYHSMGNWHLALYNFVQKIFV